MPFAEEQLDACVRKLRPGAQSTSFTSIKTGKFNTSFFVDADGEELVLRIAPSSASVFCFYEKDMMKQEPRLHQLLRDQTDVPVPEILLFDDSQGIIARDYLIMNRLPGTPISDCRCDSAKVLRQVGECLAQVHRITADQHGYLGEHNCMAPQPTWKQAFTVMWHKLIDDIVGVGHYDDGEAHFMRKVLDQHLACFDRDVPAALLHMDVWAQNIMVDADSNLTGLVDWDRALWGDVEIEFAVLDYCGISEPAFWEGYGRMRDDSPEAEVRRLFYLLYEIQKYIVINQGRRNDTERALRYKQQTMQLISRLTD